MESQQSNKPIYVNAGNASEFFQYKRENSDRIVYMIVDDTTLRGKQPGDIVRIGSYDDRWNHIAIEESIERERAIWDTYQVKQVIEDADGEKKDVYGYGV